MNEVNTVEWHKVHLYFAEQDGTYSAVYDKQRKSKALIEYRDNRTLPEGYSLFPLRIVPLVKDYGDEPVIHALSLVWHRWNPEKERFFRVLDPITIRELSGMLIDRKPLPEGCTTLNMKVDYSGIDTTTSKPFNSPRFKILQDK
jgi:hypothetical protein